MVLKGFRLRVFGFRVMLMTIVCVKITIPSPKDYNLGRGCCSVPRFMLCTAELDDRLLPETIALRLITPTPK